MKDTLSLECIHFDQEDPSGLNKAAALSLIKGVLYNDPTGEVAANVLATVLLHIPYNADFNRQLHQVSSFTLSSVSICSILNVINHHRFSAVKLMIGRLGYSVIKRFADFTTTHKTTCICQGVQWILALFRCTSEFL